MTAKAEYIIAQYMADPFRKEPRNIGVIVVKGDDRAARFVGETKGTTTIDGRAIRSMPHPSIYRRWVRFWRSELESSEPDVLGRLTAPNGDNYNAIPGGQVTDTGHDAASEICNYLYDLLITPRPDSALPEDAEVEAPSQALKRDVEQEFRKRLIMGSSDAHLAHPILSGVDVRGKRTYHKPAYVQRNGAVMPMDAVDFTTPRKGPVKDHAGWMATMFADILDNPAKEKARPIAIVRASKEDLSEDIVRYSLSLLEDKCQIIDWLDASQRAGFLEERERIARTPRENG